MTPEPPRTLTEAPTRPAQVLNRTRRGRAATEADLLVGSPDAVWDALWARVPAAWHGPWVIDADPFNQLFTQNANYQPGRAFDFRPTGDPRLGQQVAWWLWVCWTEGLRKVEPSMLRWWSTALSQMAVRRQELTGHRADSVADFDPGLVVREAIGAFVARNDRTPSHGNLRNLTSLAQHVHQLVSVRCSQTPWWEHDRWDLSVDDRIPRRPHEPQAHRPVDLSGLHPAWLREGARTWLRTTLSTEAYRWSTAVSRARELATYFTPWVAARGFTAPALTTDPGELRRVWMDYRDWLRSPAAGSRGQRLAPGQVEAVENHVQGFYRFMLDHAADGLTSPAADHWGWTQLGEAHARMAATPARRARPAPAEGARTWISAADMARMAAFIEILSTPTDATVTVTAPGMDPVTLRGLGDAQAARAWMLQAMTGRRVSEILMLDYEPLTLLADIDPATAADDAFVARLRYQQTKVDGVDPTILVDTAVVHIVREQQAWSAAQCDSLEAPRYLFLAPRHNHRGLRPRPYPSHQAALRRLDEFVDLRDSGGNPLRFTRTHRLRHTRATELLNAGVPVHVVQRYLGHRSPEMTMRYAATLSATAEAEFLKAKRAGAFGADLAVSAADLYEITQLSGRTDRILPNGACLLPPAKSCDRGNACLTCGHFATDSTHLPELAAQGRRTLELVEIRQRAFTDRHGSPMPETNVWLAARRREIDSLQAIQAALTTAPDGEPVHGAGVTARTEPRQDAP